MPLREVASMPAPEFLAWMHYYAVEPWGQADRLISAWGESKPEAQDWDAAKAALTRWAEGGNGG